MHETAHCTSANKGHANYSSDPSNSVVPYKQVGWTISLKSISCGPEQLHWVEYSSK